jgi:hypothetical protein
VGILSKQKISMPCEGQQQEYTVGGQHTQKWQKESPHSILEGLFSCQGKITFCFMLVHPRMTLAVLSFDI